jgi:hypothetical protein
LFNELLIFVEVKHNFPEAEGHLSFTEDIYIKIINNYIKFNYKYLKYVCFKQSPMDDQELVSVSAFVFPRTSIPQSQPYQASFSRNIRVIDIAFSLRTICLVEAEMCSHTR